MALGPGCETAPIVRSVPQSLKSWHLEAERHEILFSMVDQGLLLDIDDDDSGSNKFSNPLVYNDSYFRIVM